VTQRPGGVTDEDRAAARAILDRCRPSWTDQGQALSEEESAQLTGLIAIVSRYSAHLGTGDLVDVLTERVASCRDLLGVLRYRLQALLADLRRRRSVPVDETGERAQAARTANAAAAAELFEQSTAARALVRAELAAARGRLAARQAVRPVPSRAGGAVEPDAVFAAELSARGIAPHAPGQPRQQAQDDLTALYWATRNAATVVIHPRSPRRWPHDRLPGRSTRRTSARRSTHCPTSAGNSRHGAGLEGARVPPTPAVAECAPARTCQGRLRRHYVIGSADP